MGFDKSKAVRTAEKHLAQGKISAAIAEYRRIVEHDPKDFAALNTLGDLYVREDKKADAIRCFTAVAEHYRSQGFVLKAIAMYKKIQRLDPSALDVADKLGALYEQQGLFVEARTQYLSMADAYMRAGQRRRALDVLRRIADLDPQNAEIRLKLAQSYEHEGLRFDAAEAYTQAGANLLARGDHERALSAYTQAYGLDPLNQEALAGMVAAHCARGTPEDAAELLERAIADDSENDELRAMLVRVRLEAEDLDEAERAARELFERETHSYTTLIEVARAFINRGETNRAVALLAQAVEPALAARDEEILAALLDQALERDPDQIEALRLLVRIHTWQRDDAKLRATLERMIEAARERGLEEEVRAASDHLRRLLTEEPLQTTNNNLRHEGVSEFEATAFGAEIPASPFQDELALSDPAAIEWNGIVPTTDRFDSALGASERARREQFLLQELESVDFYLAQGYLDIARSTLEMLEQQFGPHASIAERRSRLRNAAEELAEQSFEVSAQVAVDAHVEPSMAEIEAQASVIDVAIAEDSFGSTQDRTVGSSPHEKALASSNGDHRIDSGFAALIEEFRNELGEEEPPAAPSDYETHYNLGVAYKEMDLLDEAIEEFQKAVALVSPQDGTPRYLQCCNLLGHCFMQKGMPRVAVMWFRRGLDAPGHSEDEYQALRYELGNAYEQMGDIERAIEIFSEVYGINVSYRGVAERLRRLQEQREVVK